MLKHFFIVFSFCLFISFSASAQTQFQTLIQGPNGGGYTYYYGSGLGGDFTLAMQQTTDGGYIICNGVSASYTAGDYDMYLVKLDGNGNVAWTRTYGGTGTDYGRCVQQTTDGGYIMTGATSSFGAGGSDVFLVKTDVSGNLQWSKTYGGSGNEDAASVQQTADGGYIIIGCSKSSNFNKFSTASYFIYVVKTDASGNLSWSNTYEASTNVPNEGLYVQQATDGGYIIDGNIYDAGCGNCNGSQFLLKLDAAGNKSWAYTYTHGFGFAGSVQQTADGGFMLSMAADYGLVAHPGDIELCKTDSMGMGLWTKQYEQVDGYSADFCGSFARQTSDLGYIVTGSLPGQYADRYYLFKTDVSGNITNINTYSADSLSDDNDARYVNQTADGGYIVAGVFPYVSYLYIVKTDASLNSTCNSEPYPVKTVSTGTFTPTTYSLSAFSPPTVAGTPTITVGGGSAGTAGGTICPVNVTITATSFSICVGMGSSTILSASGAVSYSWYPSTMLSNNTSAVVTASPTATITYTLTGTILGFTGSTSVMVTVSSTGACSPLPIELLSFDAKRDGSAMRARCDWSTATETNNDYFAIERSQDAITFTQIGTVKGAGTSSTQNNYSFYDEFPFSGWSYYRLKQVDFNGNYTYSNIATVYIGYLDITALYPNPASDNVTISISTEQNTEATAQVYNTLGQIVYKRTIELQKGKTEIKIPVGEFATGQYMIKVSLPSGDHAQKVFIR